MRASWILSPLLLFGCAAPPPVGSLPGVAVVFDLDADLDDPSAFYDLPYPLDGRRSLAGYPMPPGHVRGAQLRSVAGVDRGFGTFPTLRFRFAGGVAPRHPDDGLLDASWDAPAVLVAPSGDLVPLVAQSLTPDDWTPPNLLALQPAPGFVLDPTSTYVALIHRDWGDLAGDPLGAPEALREQLVEGLATRAGFDIVRAVLAFSPWELDDVAAATVFTTRDVVRETRERLADVRSSARPNPGPPSFEALHDRFCAFVALVDLPQFQVGAPPFDEGGTWPDPVVDDEGRRTLPVQRTDRVPLRLAVPRAPMPAAGYPLVVYTHGSHGSSSEFIDRGPRDANGEGPGGLGPAHVLAARGIASAGFAHLLVEERLGEAIQRPYLNLSNLAAYPGTWQQGIADHVGMLDVLANYEVPPEALGDCDVEGPVRFDLSSLALMGQSAGAHLATEVAAVDDRVTALMPTGSGGFWSELMAGGSEVGGPPEVAALLLSTDVELTTLHPGLALLQAAWEPAEPMVFASRVSDRPLDKDPIDVFLPASQADGFFPEPIYDAMAVAYGLQRAGETLWTEMDELLAAAGEVPTTYPVRGNRDGWTGVVVQWAGDGVVDPHGAFAQIEALKHQYACFLAERAVVEPTESHDAPCE